MTDLNHNSTEPNLNPNKTKVNWIKTIAKYFLACFIFFILIVVTGGGLVFAFSDISAGILYYLGLGSLRYNGVISFGFYDWFSICLSYILFGLLIYAIKKLIDLVWKN